MSKRITDPSNSHTTIIIISVFLFILYLRYNTTLDVSYWYA